MRYLGEALHQRCGFTVSGILLSGHGVSPHELEASRWPDWLRSAEEGLDALSRRCPHVAVVGFSMGGLLALLLAQRHPDKVRGIALLATPLFASPAKARLAAMLWRLPGVRGHVVRRARRLQEARMPWKGHLSPVQATFTQLKWLLRRKAALVECPALVVHSKRDRSVPWQNALALCAILGPSCKATVLLSASGHVLPLDTERDFVAQTVADFLAGVLFEKDGPSRV